MRVTMKASPARCLLFACVLASVFTVVKCQNTPECKPYSGDFNIIICRSEKSRQYRCKKLMRPTTTTLATTPSRPVTPSDDAEVDSELNTLQDSVSGFNWTQPHGANLMVSVLKLLKQCLNGTEQITNYFAREQDVVKKRRRGLSLLNFTMNLAEDMFNSDVFFSNQTNNSPGQAEALHMVLSLFERAQPAIACTLNVSERVVKRQKNIDSMIMKAKLLGYEKSLYFDMPTYEVQFPIGSLHKAIKGSKNAGISTTMFHSGGDLLLSAVHSTVKKLSKRDDTKLNSHIRDLSFGRFNILLAHNSPNKSSKRRGEFINSGILTVSVQNMKQRAMLAENVTITMALRHPAPDYEPRCKYWAVDTLSLESDGCGIVSRNFTHAKCSCNHLTSFVIIMSLMEESEEDDWALSLLTNICCSFSIFFLLLSFISFVSFPNLRGERNTIHANLVFCLGISQLIFLVGVGQTDNKVACKAVAVILHFFFLATFCWMAVEGLEIYLKLVVVFDTLDMRILIPLCIGVGYVVPAIIVAVSFGVFSQGYGTPKACWLSKERWFHLSFIGPTIVVMLWNSVMLTIAIGIMCRHFHGKHSRDRSAMAKMKAWLKGSTTLAFLLGITWAFGFLYLGGSSTIVFAYIFVLLNGSQGIVIFAFHCLGNEMVRREYRHALRQADWIPDRYRDFCIRMLRSASDEDTTTKSTSKSPGKTTYSTSAPTGLSMHSTTEAQSLTLIKQPLQARPEDNATDTVITICDVKGPSEAPKKPPEQGESIQPAKTEEGGEGSKTSPSTVQEGSTAEAKSVSKVTADKKEREEPASKKSAKEEIPESGQHKLASNSVPTPEIAPKQANEAGPKSQSLGFFPDSFKYLWSSGSKHEVQGKGAPTSTMSMEQPVKEVGEMSDTQASATPIGDQNLLWWFKPAEGSHEMTEQSASVSDTESPDSSKSESKKEPDSEKATANDGEKKQSPVSK